MQETCINSDFEKNNGHKLLHHGLKSISSSLIERGVAIIIYPSLSDDYKEARELPLNIFKF